MGYTHYWKHSELPADLVAEITRDARIIVGTARAQGVGIAGPDGTGDLDTDWAAGRELVTEVFT